MPPTDDPILDTARDLSERDPGWTMTTLAHETGVSRATLYRRFPSRAAIVDLFLDGCAGHVAAS